MKQWGGNRGYVALWRGGPTSGGQIQVRGDRTREEVGAEGVEQELISRKKKGSGQLTKKITCIGPILSDGEISCSKSGKKKKTRDQVSLEGREGLAGQMKEKCNSGGGQGGWKKEEKKQENG